MFCKWQYSSEEQLSVARDQRRCRTLRAPAGLVLWWHVPTQHGGGSFLTTIYPSTQLSCSAVVLQVIPQPIYAQTELGIFRCSRAKKRGL